MKIATCIHRSDLKSLTKLNLMMQIGKGSRVQWTTWVAAPISVVSAGQPKWCRALCSSSARPMPLNVTA